MESSSAPSKFRFRDHQEFQSSMHSEPSSDISSVSSDRDSEPEIESMTGRGIKHLCSELLELKEEASDDLQKNIFANYSAFVRILEEVKGVESELVQLENHFVTHKRLVKDLIDRVYPKILSEETANSTLEDDTDVVTSTPGKLEFHINDVSEKLDILLSENRTDEALDLIESADEYLENIQFENHYPESEMMLYNSMISERKSMLILQLTQISEDPKIAAPELRKALAGICRLGDSQLAVHLLLRYYHLRIVTGTYNLQSPKSSLNGIYIRELAKFVFSMISQAARSFVIFCGETSPYASELMLWACEETKSFITCLDKYVKCISEIRGGLSTAIKDVQFAVSCCSLLENQKLVLRPYLVRHISPCVEEVLHLHINHFKKVIAIFSASDPWVLERYLVSGVIDGGSSSLVVGQQPEYCLLTTSGRKFLTLLQAIIEDISPLVALQMGSSVISGLMNLFREYIFILESALAYETSTREGSSRIKLAESLPQQLSVLANLSTLAQFLSIKVKSIFRSKGHMDSQLMENHSVVCQQQELDDFILCIEEGFSKLRYKFCQQFIDRVLSTYSSYELTPAIHNSDQCDANTICNLTPSGVFQILFLELRKLEQLAKDNVFEVDWLMGLLRELMESMFIWVSKNKEIHATTEENMSLEPDDINQFVLDVQFLVEIGMYGGYFSNDPLLLLTLMKSTFLSAGLDPFRGVNCDGWAIDIATKTIQKLLEIEKTGLAPKEPVVTHNEDIEESHENQSAKAGDFFSHEDDTSSSENGIDAEETEADKDELEVTIKAETASLNRDGGDKGTLIQLENTDAKNAAGAERDELQIVDKLWDPTSSVGEVGEKSEETKSELDEYLIHNPVNGTNIEMLLLGTALAGDSAGIEGQDVGDSAEFDLDNDHKKIASMVCAEDCDGAQMTAVAGAFMYDDHGEGEVVSLKGIDKESK